MDIIRAISDELHLQTQQVQRTLELFEEGGTVPFIARYRKDVTGNLDEVQIRAIEERHLYLKELLDRKATILESIRNQDKLTPELEMAIDRCSSKTELEDLYLPYRPKRRTRAMIARERGLEPLADRIWAQTDTSGSLELLARPYIDFEKQVETEEAALAGARDIIAERIADSAHIRTDVRRLIMEQGIVTSNAAEDWTGKTSKFEMYYDFREPIKSIPSHRYLAIERGIAEGVLQSKLENNEAHILALIEQYVVTNRATIALNYLKDAIEDAYQRLMAASIETDVRAETKERADTDALKVFQANLRALLLASPLGGRCVIGLDPGFRTGVKVAVVSATGKYLANDVIYPVPPLEKVAAAKLTLRRLIKTHAVEAIAIGNGTASRETEAFVREFTKENPELNLIVAVVSESGASIYSASDIAREEFPDLDVTVRGAISIGRRLQDPLAELVKLDPKAIGVGQYQHDVNQKRLKKCLSDVVESSVNFVGVEVNTSSAELLRYVAGIGESLARAIVAHRDSHGPFRNRPELREVTRFGPKAFQQAAGFLRIRDAVNPLDQSAVHPEHYPIVEKMAENLRVPVTELMGNKKLLDRIDISQYVHGSIGEFTLRDIQQELMKPGRDPRDTFEAMNFDPSITEVAHLREGMVLEGSITNVTDFGCFVDIGVHQDGLVHVSRISDKFVKDPKEVVKVGERVNVRVLSVEFDRKRISLSLRESDIAGRDPTNDTAGQRERSFADPGTHRNDATKSSKKSPPMAKLSPAKTPFNNAFSVLQNLKQRS